MFERRCDSGIHFLHNEFPHGRVTGSRRGYEHCGHCASLTICLASLEASRGPFEKEGSMGEELDNFDIGDRRGTEVLLRGSEDIGSVSTSAGLDSGWGSSICF